MGKPYDFLVVGAGLFGASFAYLAKKRGKRVLVVEKRDHIGGNAYSYEERGIEIHRYGAHIFHTDDEAVWNFVNSFLPFNRFTNSPVANYKGELYPLPFNMHTFHAMWGVLTPDEAKRKIEEGRREITGEPSNLEEQAISLVGRDVYAKLVSGYTEKQWGRPCKDLPPFIIKRLPVRFTYDNNYFSSRFQGIPIGGYGRLVGKMLEGIEVRLSRDYLKDKEYYDSLADKVLYTGPIDAYFGYRLGHLEYRTVRFETKFLETPNFQGVAVMNYTDRETPYTRVIEHKWFTFGKDIEGNEIPHTAISYEYSKPFEPGDEPYYPINDERNETLYKGYKALADKEGKTLFGGRLGQYRYYDMDKVLALALDLAKKELE